MRSACCKQSERAAPAFTCYSAAPTSGARGANQVVEQGQVGRHRCRPRPQHALAPACARRRDMRCALTLGFTPLFPPLDQRAVETALMRGGQQQQQPGPGLPACLAGAEAGATLHAADGPGSASSLQTGVYHVAQWFQQPPQPPAAPPAPVWPPGMQPQWQQQWQQQAAAPAAALSTVRSLLTMTCLLGWFSSLAHQHVPLAAEP